MSKAGCNVTPTLECVLIVKLTCGRNLPCLTSKTSNQAGQENWIQWQSSFDSVQGWQALSLCTTLGHVFCNSSSTETCTKTFSLNMTLRCNHFCIHTVSLWRRDSSYANSTFQKNSAKFLCWKFWKPCCCQHSTLYEANNHIWPYCSHFENIHPVTQGEQDRLL